MRKKIKKTILSIYVFLLLIIPIVLSTNWQNNLIDDLANRSYGVATGDMNNDGDIDIIAALGSPISLIRLYENNGDETFTETLNISKDASRIKIVDLNGDGYKDIVSCGMATGGLWWHKNNGTGLNFTSYEILVDRCEGLDVSDLDGDGDYDIVIGTIITDALVYLENDGMENFNWIDIDVTLCDDIYDVVIYDINLDGEKDILVATRTDNLVVWYKNDGFETFTKLLIDNTEYHPHGVDAGDLDGDGDIDIVAISTYNVTWYENNGEEAFFGTKELITSINGGRAIEIFDIDNDGDNDIISSSDKLMWHDNDGEDEPSFSNWTIAFIGANHYIFHFVINDIDEDDREDIIFSAWHDDELWWYKNLVAAIICDYPALFCDDFDYTEPMNTRGWYVETGIGIIDNTFTPIDNKLDLSLTSTSIIPRHETMTFKTMYRPDSSSAFTEHYLSPVFSTQFTLYFNNITDNIFEYQADQKYSQTAYIIRTEIDMNDSIIGGNSSGNMNWYYLNDTEPNWVWILICGNCTTSNENLEVKINSYFQQRDSFVFNSTIIDDEIDIYVDNVLLGTVEDYLFGEQIEYLSRYAITKYNVGRFTIDDYYIMVGTDKDTPTVQDFYIDIFDNKTVTTIELGTGETGDMATYVGTIWEEFGLRSLASRMIAGLFLMFLLAITMFGAALSMKTTLSPAVLIVVEFFFIILLTFIKLLPIWLPFVVILFAAGIGAIVFKMGSQT